MFGQSNNSEFPVSFCPVHKTITVNMSMTSGIMLGSENSELQVIGFCSISSNDNSEFFFYICNQAWE